MYSILIEFGNWEVKFFIHFHAAKSAQPPEAVLDNHPTSVYARFLYQAQSPGFKTLCDRTFIRAYSDAIPLAYHGVRITRRHATLQLSLEVHAVIIRACNYALSFACIARPPRMGSASLLSHLSKLGRLCCVIIK